MDGRAHTPRCCRLDRLNAAMTQEVKVLRLFPTPVIVGRVDDAETINTDLEAAILARMDADAGVRRSNVGGWHSSSNLLAWSGDAGRLLTRQAIELANAHTLDANGKAVTPAWRIEAWANVSGPGDANVAHVHGAAYWSVVYYVRVGKGAGGRLVLHDPRMPALRMHAPGLQLKDATPEQVARIEPQAGQIIMFPSWLSHGVEAWDGEGLRISIAMNLSAQAAPGRDATAVSKQS
jgi:uncharacterized protein (TIGR02466 family)